ncbi:hypothetical protein SAMN04488514_102462 [Kriegella aquimaris]|uniref:Uncharacterized protein n=1 Tax=Kriegella aquimaris TaxID=192904 RepID=A0A1G9MDT0_9FLAO|nr:hypothetical protein SAMN04488514_102462 [Kriegella aquimaris]
MVQYEPDCKWSGYFAERRSEKRYFRYNYVILMIVLWYNKWENGVFVS